MLHGGNIGLLHATDMSTPKYPRKLYKYRSFGANSLRLLSEAEVFYAKPQSLNDPLDCDPGLQIDTDLAPLEELCYRMLVAAKGEKNARAEIRRLRSMSAEPADYKTGLDTEKYYMRCLGSQIKDLLDAEMSSTGVFSLAQRWECHLMWSHYADEHRGLCIEYDLTDNNCSNLKPVSYKRPRSIKVSELLKWKLGKSAEAEQSIQGTYFFTKSPQWRYEREWRDIHRSSGANPAPFPISGVYFGLRCDTAVQTCIVKLLANSNPAISFYELYTLEDGFRLRRRRVDAGEIEGCGVRSSALLDFRDVFLDESVGA